MYAPFTILVSEGEISILTRLHGMLESKPIEERVQFSDLMNAAFKLCKMDYGMLANDLGYSPSAVYRWVEGTTAPHKSLWPSVVAWIMKAIEVKIQALEQRQKEVADCNRQLSAVH